MINLDNNSYLWDQVDPFDTQDKNFWVKVEHLGRYLFAADYLRPVKPHLVADIACGKGYGVAELSKVADFIIGVDNTQEILNITNENFGSPKLTLINHDLDNDNNLVNVVGESSLDAIVCFETLEHLLDANKALSQFAALLRPQGILICSVPNVIFETRDLSGLPSNKCHKQFFSYSSISRLLKQNNFEITYRIGQAWANIFFKRESELIDNEYLSKPLGDYVCINSPEMIHYFARLIAYPTVEDVDGSYSIILVAHKNN